MADFLGYALKSVTQDLVAGLESVFDKTPNEFDSFQDELNLYVEHQAQEVREAIPFEFLRAFLESGGATVVKFPMPEVIKGNMIML